MIFTNNCTGTAHCALWSVHFALYTVHCALYTVHCALWSVHCALYTVQCALWNVHCALWSVHCTLYIVHCTLFTAHCRLYIVHCTLCIAHWTLCTVHCKRNTVHWNSSTKVIIFVQLPSACFSCMSFLPASFRLQIFALGPTSFYQVPWIASVTLDSNHHKSVHGLFPPSTFKLISLVNLSLWDTTSAATDDK